ncbi:MAG: alanine--tRNA ligase-related protein [Defluviitaleaceae bacterium]|nr:alanine--tRNA ligase-related protein [Defluviitaleaceae bacterium]
MRKTDKLYYSDYKGDFTAEILEITQKDGIYLVVLDKTCFYPGGGGQPADTGTLGDFSVVDMSQHDGVIYHHITQADEWISVGDSIEGFVDLDRRRGFMQNHTGEHILSGYAKSRFDATNVGFHMSERGFTMDLDKPLTLAQVQELENLANDAVADENPVMTAFYTGEDTRDMTFRAKKQFADDEQVRIVTVDVYDTCACAGLHVSNTAEVDFVKIVGYQKYKGGVRLTVYCGQDAFWDYSRKHAICKQVGEQLSADTDSIITSLDKLIIGKAELKKQLDKLRNENLEMKAQTVENGVKLAYFVEGGLEADDMRRFANLIAERAGVAVVICGGKYAIASHSQPDLEAFVADFNRQLDGRGGVGKQFAQGAIKADISQIVAFLESVHG